MTNDTAVHVVEYLFVKKGVYDTQCIEYYHLKFCFGPTLRSFYCWELLKYSCDIWKQWQIKHTQWSILKFIGNIYISCVILRLSCIVMYIFKKFLYNNDIYFLPFIYLYPYGIRVFLPLTGLWIFHLSHLIFHHD